MFERGSGRGLILGAVIGGTIGVLGMAVYFLHKQAEYKASVGEPILIRGKMVLVSVPAPHYEVIVKTVSPWPLPARPPAVVIAGAADLSEYVNRNVEVYAVVDRSPNIWGRPIAYVMSIIKTD